MKNDTWFLLIIVTDVYGLCIDFNCHIRSKGYGKTCIIGCNCWQTLIGSSAWQAEYESFSIRMRKVIQAMYFEI